MDLSSAAGSPADVTVSTRPPRDRLPLPSLLVFALLGFLLISTETMPAGILPQIAAGMQTSPQVAERHLDAFRLTAPTLNLGPLSTSVKVGLDLVHARDHLGLNVKADAAFALLVWHSQRSNRKLHAIAADVMVHVHEDELGGGQLRVEMDRILANGQGPKKRRSVAVAKAPMRL